MFQIRARARAPLFGAPARALVQLSMDSSCPFPRGNREHACWESRARLLGSVRSMKYAYWEASGSKKIKRSQLTSTSELKLLSRPSAARKQLQCVICCSSQDLQHRVRNKENIRGPTSRPLIRSSQIMFHVRITPQSPIRFLGSTLIIE